jgi:hypothetical protein
MCYPEPEAKVLGGKVYSLLLENSPHSPMKSTKSNSKIPIATKININIYYTFAYSYNSNYDVKED